MQRLWFCLLLAGTLQGATQKPIVVVIPSYNNAAYYERNLSTLF